jgi:transcriptional regulator with XRE-family HTH domain
MTPDGTPDHQLHQFLTAARARLRPEDIGIRPPANRRGAGLHQSDLADALVVSDRWYNGFENGTPPPSRYDALVSRLGELLRLSPAEHLYLHLLATRHEPALPAADAAVDGDWVRPVLEQMLALLGPGLPAITCDIAWNVIAWNQAMTDHLAWDAAMRSGATNVILWLFSDDAKRIVADLDYAREAEIGNVVLALARYPGDQRLRQLVAQLQEIPAARRLWVRQRIPDDPVVSPRRVHLVSGGTYEGHLLSLEFPGRLRLHALVPGASWLTAMPSLDGHRRLRKRTVAHLGVLASA